jgi:hypothetical protein
MAAKPRYQVIELYDALDPVLPRYVCAQRQGRSAWRVTWENRDKLTGKLAAWFRELAAEGREPAERVLLGRGAGLTLKTAFSLAAFRVAEINRAATGSPDEMADFLMMDSPENVGGRGRPTAVVGKDGAVQTFPSIAALARAAGLARQTVSRAIHRGVPGRGWGGAATPRPNRSTP